MRLIIASAFILGLAASASAQTKPGLPIEEGLWVTTSEKCATAQTFYVYHGFTFGETGSGGGNAVSFPPIETLVMGKDGFVRINGELEIKPNANGTAILRAYSPVEGEIWREALKRCTENELSDWMRGTAQSIRTVPTAPAVYLPSVAKGTWSLAGSPGNQMALYSGDGLIQSIALSCADNKSVTFGIQLRREAPIDATRAMLVYEYGSIATTTAIFRSTDDNRWLGAADDGIVDTLDTQSQIIIDMGPAGSEQIPLAGSRAAIRPALAPCWTTRR